MKVLAALLLGLWSASLFAQATPISTEHSRGSIDFFMPR